MSKLCLAHQITQIPERSCPSPILNNLFNSRNLRTDLRLPTFDSDPIRVIRVICVKLRLCLARAVANLIDNAIPHNRPSGEIRMTGRVQAPHSVLEVADSGDGIPDHELRSMIKWC